MAEHDAAPMPEGAADRDVLDDLAERVARYDPRTLIIRYVNRAKADDHDLEPATMIGRPLDEVLSPGAFRRLRDHLAALGPDNPMVWQVNELRRPGREPRWIEWVDRYVPHPDGGDVLSVGRDITLARTRHAGDGPDGAPVDPVDLPIGTAVIGLDHRLEWVNAALCQLLERSEDELLERSLLDLLHPDDVRSDLTYGFGSSVALGGDVEAQRYLCPDGRVVWAEVRTTTVRDAHGRPRHRVAQFVDVTARIQGEQQLRHEATSNEHRATRLEEVDRVKNTFLTAVSHELRNPLTVLRGMTTTLRRLDADADPALRTRIELALERQASRLSHLLDELLDVDRLARGTLTVLRQDLDLTELVHEAARLSPVRERLRIDAPGQCPIRADRVQVERIVSNLLDNAVKYAPQAPVEVLVRRLPPDGFRLEVRDAGPGIPADHRLRVFEAFHRIDPDDARPGTGIGLALVAEFARLHGGRAWAEAADDGAHLVVEVPPTDRHASGTTAG